MPKNALREQRRAARLARQRQQRMIYSGVFVVVLLAVAFFLIQSWNTQRQASLATSIASTAYAEATATQAVVAAAAASTQGANPGGGITTASGLKILDEVVGTGATAKAGDTVSVHYTGWLTNGTKFDSSVDRGQPFQFVLGAGNVIKGWDEGVAGMKVGGKRKLTIPPDLGYGATGQGTIPANATLIFEVQLLSIP